MQDNDDARKIDIKVQSDESGDAMQPGDRDDNSVGEVVDRCGAMEGVLSSVEHAVGGVAVVVEGSVDKLRVGKKEALVSGRGHGSIRDVPRSNPDALQSKTAS